MTTNISPNQFIIEAPDWKTFFQSLSELDGSTTDKGHILSSAYFEPILQKVFKKLSEEDIWEEYETESYSSKQDLSLLQAYINGLCLFDKESY